MSTDIARGGSPRVAPSSWCAGLCRAALVLLLSVLAACAQRGAPVPTEPPIRTIAIIPVWQAEEVSIERLQPLSMLPLAVLAPAPFLIADKLDMVDKRRAFTARFGSARQTIGMELTSALADAGTRRGFRTIVLNDMPRSIEDPDDIDYATLETEADVIVHVRVKDFGVQSPRKVDQYLPRISLGVLIVSRRTGTELLNENFEYGAEATDRTFSSVESDARYAFPDFIDLMTRSALVEESWHAGAQALGSRVIEQIRLPQ
jgi:hypothetical protein